MSSTSSSDNDCGPGFRYGSGIRDAGNARVYPYLGGHPLVYYAHVPQNRRTQRHGISRKNNPNCFMKAFHWYTQELPSPQAENRTNNVNIGGFAAWLDRKYEEFLQDSKCEQHCPKFRLKQRSVSESDDIINRVGNEPRKPTKFPRLKSPWKKKRRFINTEKGSFCEKPHSFEFILRPQEMSRPASECCQKTSCCNRSNATFVTSKSTIATKFKMKSHSMTCITKPRDTVERQISVTLHNNNKCIVGQRSTEKFGIVENTTNQDLDFKVPMNLPTREILCECKRDSSNFKNVSIQYKEKTRKDTASCQCSLYNIQEINASCQYCGSEQPIISKKEKCVREICFAPCCQCPQPQKQRIQQTQQICEPSIKSVDNSMKNKETPILKGTVVHSVQTSDHSITFEENTLFVKILCENK